MFLKRFTSLTVATATALTLGFSAPAQAMDDDDLAKILFGLLATGALVHAIDQNKDKKRSRSSHSRPADIVQHRSSEPRHERRRAVNVTRPNAHLVVPATCKRQLNTQVGPRTYVGRPCLSGQNYDMSRLPQSCRRDLDFGHRKVRAWGTHCLSKAGYRFR